MTRQTAATAFALALTVGAVGATIAQGQEEATTPADRTAVGELAPQLPALVAAFRRSQGASDRIGPPDGSSTPGAETGDLRPGEAPQYARRLASANGQGLYAWPARGEMCVSTGSSGGCVSTSLLAHRGALVGTRFLAESTINDSEVHQVFIVARDGVDEVVIRSTDGSELIADTRENGALLDVATEPVSARWRNVDGTVGEQRIAGP